MKTIFFVALLLVSIVIPALVNDPYWTDVFTSVLIFVILSASLRLVFSTGQISFAHPGLAAIGGYCSGALTLHLGISFWVAFPAAGLMAALASLIIGYPTLRLKGVHFFLITFIFTSLMEVLIGNFGIPIFGGWKGLISIPRPCSIAVEDFFKIEFIADLPYYYLTLFLTTVAVGIIYSIERSRYGLVFNAIEDADLLAESVGINLMKYKLLAFAVAGFFAGIAGSLFAHYQRIITPYNFDLYGGILLFIYIVVGGTGTIIGPILGVIFIRLLSQVLHQYGEYETMILGFVLILSLLFIPGGLVSLPQRLAKFISFSSRTSPPGGGARDKNL